jgi:hypothetical protein
VALESTNGEATGAKYRGWFDQHVAPLHMSRWTNQPILDGETSYRFRCSLLHQGTTQHPKSGYTRILFVEPGAIGSTLHMNVLNDALNIDVQQFSLEVVQAAVTWPESVAGTEPYETNVKSSSRDTGTACRPTSWAHPSSGSDFTSFLSPRTSAVDQATRPSTWGPSDRHAIVAASPEESQMSVTLQITVDCTDPARLVEFWSAALGYVVEPPPGGFATWTAYWRSLGIPEDELPPEEEDTHDSIVDPDGIRPRIWFQPVPETKAVKNRLHLDLKFTGDRSQPLAERRRIIDDKVAELETAGATSLRVLTFGAADYYAVVMCDPEGNEFCVA